MNTKHFGGQKKKLLGNDLEGLPDGTYKLEVEKSGMGNFGNDGLRVDLNMIVLWGPEGSEGMKFKHAEWVRDADSAARFLGTLFKLGFDVDSWSEAGTQEEMVVKAVRYMAGMRIEANKSSKHDDKKNKTYHNLYLNSRAEGDDFRDGKPEKISNEELEQWCEDHPDLENADAESIAF